MFITYMSGGFVRTLLSNLLSRFGLVSLYILVANLVIYMPFLFVLIISTIKGKKHVKLFSFLFLFLGLAFLFWMTLLSHPLYEPYFTRRIFGVLDSVFRPDFGAVWGFLLIVASENKKRVNHNLHLGAFLLMIYCIYQYSIFLRTGYWTVYNYLGELENQSYSLDFSYSCCFCAEIFIVAYTNSHKNLDLVSIFISVLLMALGGSRGSLACLGAFIVLFYFKSFLLLPIRKRFFFAILFVIAVFVLYAAYPFIIAILSRLDSRSIQAILSGSIMEDNGRLHIYELAKSIIDYVPTLGYGPFGDRPYIAPYYYWGYVHSLYYEMIIDFGWTIGIGALVLILIRCIHVYLKGDKDDLAVISILVGMNVKLFISGSFWSHYQFWMLLAYIFIVVPIKGIPIQIKRGS